MRTEWQQPSHPGKIKIVSQEGDFASYAISQSTFAPGTLLARLSSSTGLKPSRRAYSSVQVGPDVENDHVELMSDFLFINHSCDPNLEFHVSRGLEEQGPSLSSPLVESTSPSKSVSSPSSDAYDGDGENEVAHSGEQVVIDIRVARRVSPEGKELGVRAGEMLTFFYPSTEWEMDQAFDCLCGATNCKKVIQGAKFLSCEELTDYFINTHIWELKKRQTAEYGTTC